MEIDISASSTKASVKLFFIRVLIIFIVVFSSAAGSFGVYLLKTFLPMYNEEKDIKKRSLEPITATVISVDREFTKNNTIGYMKVSYEYNGNNYVSDYKYYEESSFHYSTSKESGRHSRRENDNDSAMDNWEELQSLVGTEQEVFVDTSEPDKVFYPLSDDSIKALKIMAIIGFALISVVAAIIIFTIILAKKIIVKNIKKNKTEGSLTS